MSQKSITQSRRRQGSSATDEQELVPTEALRAGSFREIQFHLLSNQLADAFGCHQPKDVRSGQAEKIAFGRQLERAHGYPVL
jgi:hypothetical protein